jgi:DNA-binding transcriptional LysR family regulator
VVTACTVTPLFDALQAFHLAHPGVEIALVEDNSDRLIERVRIGAIDLALVGAAGAPPPGLQALPIISEGLAAAVPAGHPLAGRPGASLAEVCAHPIVCLPEGTGVRTVLEQECAAQGLHPDISLQASAPDAVADLAVRGLGVAILSASMAAGYADRLEAVAIDDLETPAVLALVWTSTVSPALRQLLGHATKAFDQRAQSA